MAWIQFVDDRGRPWAVNQDGLWIFVRQYLHAKMIHDRTRVNVERNWFGPDVHNVETDFRNFREEKDEQAARLYDAMARTMLASGDGGFEELVQMKRDMDEYGALVLATQREASRATMANIDASVRFGERGAAVAGVVRDLSATTLVVGASFLTGGAAVAVLGGGSALKGTGKYQDTGNVGSAVIEGAGTFVVGMIAIAPQLSAAAQGSRGVGVMTQTSELASSAASAGVSATERGVLVVVGAMMDGSFELTKGLVEGKSMQESVAAAALKATAAPLAATGVGALLEKVALPVLVRVGVDTLVSTGTDLGVGAVSGMAAPRASSPVVTARPPRIPPRLAGVSDVPAQLRAPSPGELYVRDTVLRRV